jgi:hypothetical protein
LREVLEDACKKRNLDPDRHRLKRNNKILDNTLSVRYANVPNLAELELIEVDVVSEENEKPIKLAVQPEGGKRIICEHTPNTTLADILNSIEAKGHEGKKRSNGEVGVIVYMRKEIVGEDLSKTTLKGLGLTGGMSAAFRFFYKLPEILKEQANIFVAPIQSSSNSATTEKTYRPMLKHKVT